jgi:hypothetical protein
MKLLRWTLAGASFYVVYKYTIGKKAKGEKVFAAPDAEEAPEPRIGEGTGQIIG